MGRASYTADSIERALDIHAQAGRIRSWRRGDGSVRYVVELHARTVCDALELRSLRDAHIFVAGLASAGYAVEHSS